MFEFPAWTTPESPSESIKLLLMPPSLFVPVIFSALIFLLFRGVLPSIAVSKLSDVVKFSFSLFWVYEFMSS